MKFIRQTLSLFSVILLGSIALLALRVVYEAARPERPPYTETQQRLVSDVTHQVRDWLATLPPAQTRAVFANFDHDDFGFVSTPIRTAIWQSGRFDLAPRGFVERLRDRVGWTLPHWSSGADLEDYARSRRAEVALDGSVVTLADGPQPTAKIHLEIVHPATGEIVAARDFAAAPQGAHVVSPALVGKSLSPQLRLLAWLALVLLLPLAVFPFARELLVDGSNGAIALALAALVALDVASAYFLYASQFGGWFGTVLTLVIFGLSLGLNAQYLTWIKQQQV